MCDHRIGQNASLILRYCISKIVHQTVPIYTYTKGNTLWKNMNIQEIIFNISVFSKHVCLTLTESAYRLARSN